MLVAEKSYADLYRQYNPNATAYAYEEEVKKVKKVNKGRKVAKAKAVRTLMGLGAFFVISFVIVLRYAALTELTSEIDKQKKHLSSLEKTNSQLRASLVIDLNTIDSVAKNKLGMDRPYQYQTEYIDLKPVKVAEVQTEKSKSGFDIVKKVSKLVEYLY